jgi:two-component system, NarL family, captular synthesis response regulator RcsB
MYSKIIVAEDFDTVGIGLDIVLKQLQGAVVEHAKDCDQALLKLKRAQADGQPFDLLVTDLSFVPGSLRPNIADGEGLVAEARRLQPAIAVIVYSVENRLQKIRHLFETCGINGYVSKGRNSGSELLRAIAKVAAGEVFVSPEFSQVLKPAGVFEISHEDIALLKLLSEGYGFAEAGDQLRLAGQTAVSKSSIEKRVSRLKTFFNANNPIHLVGIAKDMGLI